VNQLTMLDGAIGVSRSDLITGPFPPVSIPQVGVKGNDSATFLFCNPILDGDDSSNVPNRIGNHVPRQAGNFPSPQASFYRQQDHDSVSSWVSGQGGEGEEIPNVVVR
jgi:hypothetical protein